ncbi:efflux RND transporter permease subunit [Acanthopleuribacter pedis]|uniref:Efflux RND transporter permease subunit n=1 Tax=Acanthopleuribacter pedis TaxID=442870 RepID=A0A8J7Q820_9BACT|nr:efflux RND transporter permease subunit [Acanthopleuribacter pedis]MBO1319104.1 efflux RND transporter permease subunit [Acanthopleuribacter pedis]
MIAVSLKRPVTVAMVVAALVVFGVKSYTELGRDLMPDIAYPSLTVMTRYEGAAPQEVEEFITKPLESSLSTVRGKRKINSISREGMSLITIEFEWGHEMKFATLHVREKLDNVRFQPTFPQDAERPNILRWDPSAKPIVGLAITANAPLLELRDMVQDVIKPRLEQLDGIAFAQISGDIERVIDVEINREKMVLYGLDIETIKNAIDAANANIPGGTIKKGRYRYSLRTLGEFREVEEINNVVVARRNGSEILVSDVAVVHDTAKDRDAQTTVDGVEGLGLLVYKESGANTIRSTESVKKLIETLNAEFGGGSRALRVVLAFEEAKFISQALNNVWVSLIFGGFFAFLVLVLFLSDLKSPFFIFVSIPIAIIVTLVLMYFFGLSLNIMSLGGLALGVGMLVDNSIVVLENIYRYREEGNAPLDAAFKGAREVAMPVAASTLTTVAVFFPIVYIQGVAGALFGEQALTVTFSLASSLVVSLTVLPLLTAVTSLLKGRDSLPGRLVPIERLDAKAYPRGLVFWKWWEYAICFLLLALVAGYFKSDWLNFGIAAGILFILPTALLLLKWVARFGIAWLFQAVAFLFLSLHNFVQWVLDTAILPVFNAAYAGFEHLYHAVLAWALERKFVVLLLSIGLMVLTWQMGSELKQELMPKAATGQFTIDTKLLPGTSLEITTGVVEQVEALLKNEESVALVFSQIGASEANLSQLLKDSGTNTAQISVRLREQDATLAEVRRLSDLVRGFAVDIPGMKVEVEESSSSMEDLLASEGGGGLVVQIEAETFDLLYEANQAVLRGLQQDQTLQDVKTTLTRDFPQMRIALRRDRIDHYGFEIRQIGEFLSGGMRGALATQFKEFDRSIDVRVRFSEEDREDFEEVLKTRLVSSSGISVPLAEFLEVTVEQTTKEIRRVNQRRVALVSANIGALKISDVLPRAEAMLDALELPPSVSVKLAGEKEGIDASFKQLLNALLLSAALVYMIMAAQFESLRFPFVVIFTVPMGLVGTVLILSLTGTSINIMSLIGLIVLTGIVVNDAIVKVDFINQARGEGMTLRGAVMEASKVRLRPILMTTATTVLALIPMAFGFVPWLMNTDFIHPLVLWADEWALAYSLPLLSELFSPRGAEIQQPLALVVIGGLSLATMLTLILIPVLYETLAAADKTEPASIDDAAVEEAHP